MSDKPTHALAELVSLVSDRTYGRKDSSLPYVGLEHMPSCGSRLSSVGSADDSISTNSIFAEGDILFGKLRPRLRKCLRTLRRGYCSTDILVLRPNPSVDPAYAAYIAQSEPVFAAAIRTEEGTKMPRCSWEDIKQAPAYLPQNRRAQEGIAAILGQNDKAIEKTEALIEKYQQIKAGLMHDLFTRGVLPNGRLRPTHDQTPGLYQESPIGIFPRDWSLCTLHSLLAPISNNIRSGPFGSALLKNELVEDGIPLLGIDNIHVEFFEPKYVRFVSKRKFQELSRYAVRPWDVVITIMGTVGRCCVVPKDMNLALSSKHLWTMSFDVTRVMPELICWQLNHAAWARAWFRRAMQGGIMDAIQSSTLKTLVLPLPSPDEQARIAKGYARVTSEIDANVRKLAKFKVLKNGLMQDLLTGKVSVCRNNGVEQTANV